MNRQPPTPENIFWDLADSEAFKAYYLDSYEENAELPAITIHSPYSVFSRGRFWTVFFGDGIGVWTFKNKRDAEAKTIEIIRTSKREVWVRIVDRNGRIERLNKGYPIGKASPTTSTEGT